MRLFDIRGIDLSSVPETLRSKTVICANWEEAFNEADIVFTCTVSDQRYINRKPKPGSLLLHVSLRDYLPQSLEAVNRIIVDDWQEVNREDTDIELMANAGKLCESQTRTIAQVVSGDALSGLAVHDTVMFAPMGMAVFDIAIASYYVKLARQKGIGIVLE
ncbi:hypothetical protein [Paenibacillus protaetiae]|uniref:hypothetical protein n=1 Tax=Paenibacillus protaetiae TaxID=2509456 RepID=UPI0024496C61|nr:hypothetical protein [Paenibacillus protaetiae]